MFHYKHFLLKLNTLIRNPYHKRSLWTMSLQDENYWRYFQDHVSRYKSIRNWNGQKLWVKFLRSAEPLRSCNKRSFSAVLARILGEILLANGKDHSVNFHFVQDIMLCGHRKIMLLVDTTWKHSLRFYLCAKPSREWHSMKNSYIRFMLVVYGNSDKNMRKRSVFMR